MPDGNTSSADGFTVHQLLDQIGDAIDQNNSAVALELLGQVKAKAAEVDLIAQIDYANDQACIALDALGDFIEKRPDSDRGAATKNRIEDLCREARS